MNTLLNSPRGWQALAWAAVGCGILTPPTNAANPIVPKAGPGVTVHHSTPKPHVVHPTMGVHHNATMPHPNATHPNTHHFLNTGVGGNGNFSNNNANNNSNNAVLKTLHQAHTLLVNANHDYDGHRAKAAEHVSHAIRELGHHHQGNGNAKLFGINLNGNKNAGNGNAKLFGIYLNGKKGNVPAVHEAQAQSDAQLKQAAQLIAGLHGHVPNGHKAAQHLQSAANEITTALKIR